MKVVFPQHLVVLLKLLFAAVFMVEVVVETFPNFAVRWLIFVGFYVQ
jgi:hypothetical protein